MTISVGETYVSFDGGILSAIPQALTRYSANDPQFPVNDRSPFTGKSHVVGGASRMKKGKQIWLGQSIENRSCCL
jgi:hypothetical protein